MSFWREMEFSFLKGLNTPPGPPLFATRVKKAASPINERQLAKRHKRIAKQLSEVQVELAQSWSAMLDVEDLTNLSLAVLSAKLNARFCFELQDIEQAETRFLFKPLERCFLKLAKAEPYMQTLEAFADLGLAATELYAHYEKLNHLEHFLDNEFVCIDTWCRQLLHLGNGLLEQLPDSVCRAEQTSDLALSGRLIDALDEPHMVLALILRQFLGVDSQDCMAHGLFSDCREKLLTTILAASDMELEDLAIEEPDTPLNHLDVPASDLVRTFLGSTPFSKLLLTTVPHEF